MKYKYIIFFIFFSVVISCATKRVESKSPCFSKEGGPCDRIPINTWMQNNIKVVS